MSDVMDDPNESKYFGQTEAYKNVHFEKKISIEETFLERMKQRQKERERKRNEIRKFHQVKNSIHFKTTGSKYFKSATEGQRL